MKKVGINGFGRFGMHLLQYWVDNYEDAHFDIVGINDDTLDIELLKNIIENDPYLTLKNNIDFKENRLIMRVGDNHKKAIYSTAKSENISWLGEVDVFLECSGKHTAKKDWSEVLVGQTRHVIISATSWAADNILVYGYNHQKYTSDTKVISYGSCTVNAYIPLARWIHDKWGVLDSDVHVIHNIPLHKKNDYTVLKRQTCTLEQVAPYLLNFINEDNFKVTYTLVPYTGVSMIDYRFKVAKKMHQNELINSLKNAIESGDLKGLYRLVEHDNGPEEHKFTKESSVLIESNIRMIGDNLYIGAYFDNENSATRFFDLTNYISKVKKYG